MLSSYRTRSCNKHKILKNIQTHNSNKSSCSTREPIYREFTRRKITYVRVRWQVTIGSPASSRTANGVDEASAHKFRVGTLLLFVHKFKIVVCHRNILYAPERYVPSTVGAADRSLEAAKFAHELVTAKLLSSFWDCQLTRKVCRRQKSQQVISTSVPFSFGRHTFSHIK